MAASILPETDFIQQDVRKRYDDGLSAQGGSSDTDDAKRSREGEATWDWETDAHNPYNWPPGKKAIQAGAIASIAFLASLGTSIMFTTPAQLEAEFGVTTTQSILPVSIRKIAGLYSGLICGTLFTLAAGLTHSFAGLNILRFLAGFCFALSLAIAAGTTNEMYKHAERGLPSTFFILTPFLGLGIAPVTGAFVTSRKGWRWTQCTILFFCAFSLLLIIPFGCETLHPSSNVSAPRASTTPSTPPLFSATPSSTSGPSPKAGARTGRK